MTQDNPRAWGDTLGSGVLRSSPEDFVVIEELDFEPEGEGEHVFLYLQKRLLNTSELVQRVARLSGIAQRDIGYAGMKDRRALTRQWLSVRMAGKPEPDWAVLQDEQVEVLAVERHRKKLKRGVHRGNRFTLTLRELTADRDVLEPRLQQIAQSGVPNYFGEQRFGRGGSTLKQAHHWVGEGGKSIARQRRSLYFSALRSECFNALLAQRVLSGGWWQPESGDACVLAGSRSLFRCEQLDDDISARAASGDLHPALPLWGRGKPIASEQQHTDQAKALESKQQTCEFLESQGLELAYRPARVIPHDFCWQFCDDGRLILEFSLGAGSYATAVLAELVNYTEEELGSGSGSE
jgi:tRNA pseudouridine13 synthase